MSESHGLATSWLRVFSVVARCGSFTAAGRELDYTQSAVSRQVSALESEVGAVLFDRLPRGVRLTEAGRALLVHAEAVLARLDSALGELAALRAVEGGRLRIGAFATAGAVLVPAAITALRARYPRVEVTAQEGRSAALARRLDNGELDIAVVSTTAGVSLDRLDLRHLLDDAMHVALPRAHPLAGRGVLRLAELAGEQWIAGSRTPENTLMSSCLRTGFRPRISYVVAEWTAKQGFVAAGLGVTLIPSLAAANARPDLAVVRLDPADVPPRTVYTAVAAGTAPSPAAVAFRALLEEAATVPPWGPGEDAPRPP